MKQEKIHIIGTGGHARVIAEAAALTGRVVEFIDPRETREGVISERDLFEQIRSHPGSFYSIICGVGTVGCTRIRMKVLANYVEFSDRFVNVVHPSAGVSPSCVLGQGVFIAQGAQVGTRANIGDHAIINTGAVVDHECVIGEGSHIAPGAVLSGAVSCGMHVHVGTGATIIQGIRIADFVTIGAGSLVLKDITAPGTKWVGVPARQIA